MNKFRLRAPGPVEVPPAALEALARPTLHHRTEAFERRFRAAREGLAEVASVPGDDVLILSGSGTTAFEAGLLAAVPAGAPVLGLANGKFGERWIAMAERFGYAATALRAPWGRALEPQALADALRAGPEPAAVTVVHSETSSGVLNDVQALAAAVREAAPDTLVLVDCVTSLSVTELRPDRWGLDGVFSGSQKGLMLPPGLGFAWLSERAWQRAGERPARYTLDLHRERERQRDAQTAFTPAVNLIAALEVVLGLLLDEGVPQLWARRERLNESLLAAGEATGFERYADRPSPALAALRTEDGVAPRIVEALAERGVRVAGGQGNAKPHLLRPSLLGWCDAYDAVALAAALEDAARDAGVEVEIGAATAAAQRVLAATP